MPNVITFGEIMLRLSAPDHLRISQAGYFDSTFCGAEANVAVSLANYGIGARFVSRLPDNDIARSCIRNLRSYGVDTEHCIFGGERLGIYYLERGSVARPSKIIYDRAHSSMAEIQPGMLDWDNILSDADWFHWTGITPAISGSAAEACLEGVVAASKKGITVSCDLNYRKNLWKYGARPCEVMEKLVSYCDVILGNEEDAEMVFGIKAGGNGAGTANCSTDKFKEISSIMHQRFPKAKKIVTSVRGSINADHNTWSGLLYDGERFISSPVYDITHIVDRVGSGDSFMGGLIYGLLTYGDDGKALDFATAASCLKHTIYGDYNQVSVSEVEALMAGEASGRVSR